MKLFLILACSSWAAGLVSAALGALSGAGELTLITLIHRALTQSAESQSQGWLPVAFAIACVFVLVTQVTSKVVLVRLSQATAARLRYELCSKIIAAPLPTLESVGQHRLLATLINDVGSITSALASFPPARQCDGFDMRADLPGNPVTPIGGRHHCHGGAGCRDVSGRIASRQRPRRQAREDQDEVVKQLRAMIVGIKELKGNRTRCLDFRLRRVVTRRLSDATFFDSRLQHSRILAQLGPLVPVCRHWFVAIRMAADRNWSVRRR